jgi:pimeloyl-ACP methyl ester carboxylesterase
LQRRRSAFSAGPQPPAPAGFRHANARVNGINLHYVVGGQGEPVVLLHGFPQTWYEWHRIMPQLGERYTVIAPDLRGGGLSDKPVPANGYDKKLLAEDIHQLVQQLGHSKVRLVGHDIGLMVAYAYASLYPGEVEQLVVLDAPLPGIEPIWSFINQDPRSEHFRAYQQPGYEQTYVGQERQKLTEFYQRFSRTGRCPSPTRNSTCSWRPTRGPKTCGAALNGTGAFPPTSLTSRDFRRPNLPCPCWPWGARRLRVPS